MFAKKDQQTPMAHGANNETVIAQGVKVEGDFHSQGDVVIEGEVTGSIETAQALTIGQAARIHANVSAKSAVIAGEVKGNIHATDNLELLATSIVEGDIETANLSIASGAKVNGSVTMGERADEKRKMKKEYAQEE